MTKTLYIVEFAWQVDPAVAAVRAQGAVVIAANPMVQYALEHAGVNAVSLADAYTHDEFWPLYKQTLKMTDHLLMGLDNALRAVDPRFGDEGPQAFKCLGYIIKINIDQVVCYLFQVSRAIKAHGAARLVVSSGSGLVFDENGLFAPDRSVLGHVLSGAHVQKTLGVEVEFQEPPSEVATEERGKGRFSFGQPRADQLMRGARAVLRRMLRWVKQAMNTGQAMRVLSVNCKEIETLALTEHDLGVIPLPEMAVTFLSDTPYDHKQALLEALHDSGVLDAVHFHDIPMGPFVEDMLIALSHSLECMFSAYQKLSKKIESGRFDVIVVQTLSPFNIPSIMASEVARHKGLAVVCWMHGGYGAYYSLPGYDVTDYRFTNNHLVFGQAVKDVVDSEKSVLRYDGADPQFNIYVGGSPYFAKRYENYVRPRHARKTVVLTIGGIFGYNQYYFGYDRPKVEMWNWQAHRRMVEALAPFRDRYKIIIKDYPSSEMRDTWDELVADLGGGIEVITYEQSYEDTVKAADVLIYSWVSTSLVEGLLTDADILLFDDSDISNQAAHLFEKHIVFDRAIDGFIDKMTAYLEKGDLYEQSRDPVKTYFCAATPPQDVAGYLKDLMKT